MIWAQSREASAVAPNIYRLSWRGEMAPSDEEDYNVFEERVYTPQYYLLIRLQETTYPPAAWNRRGT